ncbi:energy transducer TonB, partial [Bacteroidia bacterium]|nr:energy transducer TonB [Bacteroidia bacterium]
ERELRYPDAAMASGVQGTFNVAFVIDSIGGVSNVEIRSDSLGYGLEEEAIRVLIASSGMWNPGKIGASVVSVRLRMPLIFEIKPKTSNSDAKSFVNAEIAPEFKYGNNRGLLRYIDSCMVYPHSALRVGAEGEVLVSWVVNTTGEIS